MIFKRLSTVQDTFVLECVPCHFVYLNQLNQGTGVLPFSSARNHLQTLRPQIREQRTHQGDTSSQQAESLPNRIQEIVRCFLNPDLCDRPSDAALLLLLLLPRLARKEMFATSSGTCATPPVTASAPTGRIYTLPACHRECPSPAHTSINPHI